MKRLLLIVCIILSMGMILISAASKKEDSQQIASYFDRHVDSLSRSLNEMQQYINHKESHKIVASFKQARHYYKKIEFAIGYYFPETEVKLNGAPIPESKPHMPNEIIYPTGFQVLEEHIYTSPIDWHALKTELDGLQFGLKKLKQNQENVVFTYSTVMDALKLNIYRLMSKGLAGFDAPVSLNSLAEAQSTLSATNDILKMIATADNRSERIIHASLRYLEEHQEFETFDRAYFIKTYLIPLCEAIHDYYTIYDIPFDTIYPKVIPANVVHMFTPNAFDWKAFAPADALPLQEEYISLGKSLFFDKRLSGMEIRSCGTCHNPEKGFTDGLAKQKKLKGSDLLLRNTPTLLYAAYQPSLFYDRKVAYLEDQIHDVVHNSDEMDGNLNNYVLSIKKNKNYTEKFKRYFGRNGVNERNVKRLIAAYIRSLGVFNSRFDQYMNGDENALNNEEIKGFNLFMGKAKCGTCHFIPLFNGTLPPHWNKIEVEVLGVPQDTVHPTIIDADLGTYNLYGAAHHKYAFKTTTLRNIEHTAPYMHNGVYNTLEQVITFYDEGGGAGIGMDVENQTLSPDKLNLTDQEKQQLILFLKTLNDDKFKE